MKYPRLYRVLWSCLTLTMAMLVTGCYSPGTAHETPPPGTPPAGQFPESYYRQALAQGKNVLQISPNESLVTIEVWRAGTLARLGHDHVVASHDLHGYVALDEGRADLIMPLAKLAVDEPALRAEAGFDTQPTSEAIEGTRHNMLTKVLDADRYPFALIHVTRSDPAASTLHVSITLHGVTRTFDVPAQIETGSNLIRVSGQLALNQTDFGMTPFSVLGGAIQVQDRMDLHFRIVADKR